jgi:hypothetical protein
MADSSFRSIAGRMKLNPVDNDREIMVAQNSAAVEGLAETVATVRTRKGRQHAMHAAGLVR